MSFRCSLHPDPTSDGVEGDWSYPGYSSSMNPNPAAATFYFVMAPFTIPDGGCVGPIDVRDIPATFFGDISLPAIGGGFLEARVNGVGTALFEGISDGGNGIGGRAAGITFTGDVVITPEPGTIGLLSLGLLGVLGVSLSKVAHRAS